MYKLEDAMIAGKRQSHVLFCKLPGRLRNVVYRGAAIACGGSYLTRGVGRELVLAAT